MPDLNKNTKMQILEHLFGDENESEDESHNETEDGSDMDVKNNITITFNNHGDSQPARIASLMQPQQPLHQQVLHWHLGWEDGCSVKKILSI